MSIPSPRNQIPSYGSDFIQVNKSILCYEFEGEARQKIRQHSHEYNPSPENHGKSQSSAMKCPAHSPSYNTQKGLNFANNLEEKSADPSSASFSKLDDKTERCGVCSEKATGHLHYGAITCFSCKAFFRRAIQKEVWNEFICRLDGFCEMNHQSRKHCQKCRFEKCLAVGMKPGLVLSKEQRQIRVRKRQHFPKDGGTFDFSELPFTSCSMAEKNLPSKSKIIEQQSPLTSQSDSSSADLDVEQEFKDNLALKQENHNQLNRARGIDPSLEENEVLKLHFPSNRPLNNVDGEFFGSIARLVRTYDANYYSISLGEIIIKEMIMSSLFGIPISPSSSLASYRVMIERVTKVAQGFDPFMTFPRALQITLLTHNADLVVCLQGALFFSERMKGLEQIKHSMGREDIKVGLEMIQKIQNTQGFDRKEQRHLKPIQYTDFNSIQKLDNSEREHKFGSLLNRIGFIAGRDSAILKVFTFILLLSTDNLSIKQEDKDMVQAKQTELINMLQRLIKIKFHFSNGIQFLSKLLSCISDLRELSSINLKRSYTEEAIRVSGYGTKDLGDYTDKR